MIEPGREVPPSGIFAGFTKVLKGIWKALGFKTVRLEEKGMQKGVAFLGTGLSRKESVDKDVKELVEVVSLLPSSTEIAQTTSEVVTERLGIVNQPDVTEHDVKERSIEKSVSALQRAPEEPSRVDYSKVAYLVTLRGIAQRCLDECAKRLKESGKFTRKEDQEKIDRSVAFFSTPSSQGGPTALDRLMTLYTDFLPEGEIVGWEKQRDLEAHLNLIIEKSLNQQIDNPEQYVSHGFDHTLNVMDYTRSLIENAPEMLDTVQEKYGLVSREQARFFLLNISLFHDFGYPATEEFKLNKAAHAMAGADIVLLTQLVRSGDPLNISKEKTDLKGIFSNLLGIKDPLKSAEMIHDLGDAVLFHNADKVEGFYSAKVKTTRGEFLIDPKNAIEILSIFDTENASSVREITLAQSAGRARADEIIKEFSNVLSQAHVKVPSIKVIDGRFAGRKIDIRGRDNKLLAVGVEYSRIDLKDNPGLWVIRAADNMDIRPTRFSPLQSTALFQDYCRVLGDLTTDLGKVSLNLETAKKNSDIREKNTEELLQMAKTQFNLGCEYLVKQLRDKKMDTAAFEKAIKSADISSAKACLTSWRALLFDYLEVMPEYNHVPLELKKGVKEIAILQDTFSFRHIWGHMPIKDVQLRGDTVTVVADRALMDELNKAIVEEKSCDEKGEVHIIGGIGIGSFQVWRLREAYNNIIVYGKPVKIKVVDEEGRDIPQKMPGL